MQPPDHLLGYEVHHIVEQNPANVAKDGPAEADWLRKFGQEVVSAMDFNDQREAGLAALRYFGVLK
jgi:hypothetical protein